MSPRPASDSTSSSSVGAGAGKVVVLAGSDQVRAHLQDVLKSQFQVIPASTVAQAREKLRDSPAVVVASAGDVEEAASILESLRRLPTPTCTVLGIIQSGEKALKEGVEPDDLIRGRWDRADLIRRVRLLWRLCEAEAFNAHYREVHQGLEDGADNDRRLLNELARFLPPAVIRAVRDGVATRPPSRVELTTLFSDIRGFTDATEFHDPQDTLDMLNDYLSEVGNIIEEHGGTLDKFMGDGILAYFGDRPDTVEDHALRAVQTGLRMQARLEELKVDWFERGFLPVGIGIGITTGPTMLGTIGGGDRIAYTVVGSSVNLAARLQGLAKGGDIVISGPTFDRVRTLVAVGDPKRVQVKGFEEPVTVYAVTGMLESLDE